jgi:hypothetical protein
MQQVQAVADADDRTHPCNCGEWKRNFAQTGRPEHHGSQPRNGNEDDDGPAESYEK